MGSGEMNYFKGVVKCVEEIRHLCSLTFINYFE